VAFKIGLNIGHVVPRFSLDLGHIETKARPKPCPIAPRLGVDLGHVKFHLKLVLNLSHVVKLSYSLTS